MRKIDDAVLKGTVSYDLDPWTTRTDFEGKTGTADIGFHHWPGDY
jgi:hypothetical protein